MAQDKRYKKYQIGEYTYGNPEILSWDTSTKLIIGKYCSIAKGVTILLGGNHRTDWLTTYPFPVFFSQLSQIKGHPSTKGNVEIGNDVWICYGATILSGVKIGNGAIIAANATVVYDVPPYSIVAGNPAKVVKYRFDDKTIDTLQNICWWDWNHELVLKRGSKLLSNNISSFLKEFNKNE